MAERTSPNDQPQRGQQESQQDAAREGHSERAGEGGYGNDTGFATGTQAPRDDDGGGSVEGGTSAREEQTSNTYRDAGQGRSEP